MRSKPITVEINSLENGVSEQAAIARNKSQAEKQVNLISDLARGLISRPPTTSVSKLLDLLRQRKDVSIHTIDRDKYEKYIVVICNGELFAFDALTGEEKSVAFPTGKSYLSSETPCDDFRMVTVADRSWIANTTVPTAMDETRNGAQPYEAIIYVKRGMRSHTYTVVVDNYELTVGSEGMVAGWASECSSEDIAKVLAEGDADTDGLIGRGFDVERIGSVIKISKDTDFSFSVHDSYGNQGLVGVKGSVKEFSDLPGDCWAGTKVRVSGQDNTGLDDYYVEYRTTDGETNSSGVWVECNGWDLANSIDSATMPHMLNRLEDGTFSFEPIEWAERKVGDNVTAPAPSFIGNKITDVFFHLNRFGFASRDKVIFSRDDKYETFWPRKATEVLADDSFELATTGDNISDIYFVTPFAKSLIVMCENKQFIITTESVFSPKEAKITESTTYKASSMARPSLAGSNMFFASPNGDNTIIREYFLSEDSVTYDAADITKHVPEYILKDVSIINAHSNDDLLICFTPNTPNKLYVYKYIWIGNEKAQSSWSTFEFRPDAEILHFCYIDNSIHLVMSYGDGVYLEKLTMFSKELDEGMDFETGLDRRVTLQGMYSLENNKTVFTLPYPIESLDDFKIVLGCTYEGRRGAELKALVLDDSTHISVVGDYQEDVYGGFVLNWEYKLSTQYVRKESAPGMPALTEGRTQIMRLGVAYANSGSFNVKVVNRNQVNEYTKTGRIGAQETIIGKPVIDTGVFFVPVRAQNTNAEISVMSSSYIPVSLQKIEWSGYYAK